MGWVSRMGVCHITYHIVVFLEIPQDAALEKNIDVFFFSL